MSIKDEKIKSLEGACAFMLLNRKNILIERLPIQHLTAEEVFRFGIFILSTRLDCETLRVVYEDNTEREF